MRHVRANVALLYESGIQEHERAVGAWHGVGRTPTTLAATAGAAAAVRRSLTLTSMQRVRANISNDVLSEARRLDDAAAGDYPARRTRWSTGRSPFAARESRVLCGSLGAPAAVWDAGCPRSTGGTAARRPPGPRGAPPAAVDDVSTRPPGAPGGGRRSLVHLGLSLGGAVGRRLALDAPDRIELLVLACTAARFGDPAQWIERAAVVRASGLGAIVDAVLERWFTPSFDGVDAYREYFLNTDPEGYARCCEALSRFDVRDVLGAIDVPTLAIAATEDPTTPPDVVEAVTRGIPERSFRGDPERRASRERRAVGRFPPTVEGVSVSDDDGMRVRREVLGDEHVDRAIERTTDFTADFQDLITRYAWGEIWARPGLDRRTRSCITLTALIALGHFDELAMHVRAARRNGLTPDEIKEVLLQAAIYCGVPAANHAFAVAQQVLAEEDVT